MIQMVNTMSFDFVVLIPARYASSRFPGKPLIDIAGKPMVIRVAEQARQSGAAQVIIATDDERIANVAQQYEIAHVRTNSHHATGTDRLAQAIELLNLPEHILVINVQGDEPLIAPELIQNVAQQLYNNPKASMATAAHPIYDSHQFFNPNIVKVILNAQQEALYFSRAPVPWARDLFLPLTKAINQSELPKALPALRHIGIYAYRVNFLRDYANLPPSTLEQFEALEQLRALWHGHIITVYISDQLPCPGIDTPDDVAGVLAHFN